MRSLREQAPELLPLLLAVALPLAGVILAAQAWVTGEHRRGLRVLAAAVLGTLIWTAALTA
jgi:hypothetical protein